MGSKHVDNVSIPVLISPALGVPGPVYKYFMSKLKEHNQNLDIEYVSWYGNEGRSPVEISSWADLSDELIQRVEKIVYKDPDNPRPIIGIGHSFGGCCHRISAIKRPDLYRGVILVDSPMLHPIKRALLIPLRVAGRVDLAIGPMAATLRRKTVFKDMREVRERLYGRGIYKNWHPECFEEFLKTGFVQEEDGTIRLYGPIETEVSIYHYSPSDVIFKGTGLFSKSDTPMAFLYDHNSGSSLLDRFDVAALKKLNKCTVLPMPDKGGHMWPLDSPEQAAEVIHNTMLEIGLYRQPEKVELNTDGEYVTTQEI
eukprot:CFRG3202T1